MNRHSKTFALAALGICLALASSLFAGTVTLTYDDAGRLIDANYGNDRSISYGYDANGNLTRRIESTAPIFTDGFESGDFSAWSGVVGFTTADPVGTDVGADAAKADAAETDAAQTDAARAGR